MEQAMTGKTGELANVIFVCFGRRISTELCLVREQEDVVVDLFCHARDSRAPKTELYYPADFFGDETG